MVVLGRTWQMDFARQPRKGEKGLFWAFFVAGVMGVIWELCSF